MGNRVTGSGGYESFEHTADMGLRVWGCDLRELFEQAAAGLIDLAIDPTTVERRDSLRIGAVGDDPEEVLVAWLGEVLYAIEVIGFAPASAHVFSADDGEVRGELWGEDLDPERHELRHSIKAVTYHDLAIKKRGDLYEVRIVFDV